MYLILKLYIHVFFLLDMYLYFIMTIYQDVVWISFSTFQYFTTLFYN